MIEDHQISSEEKHESIIAPIPQPSSPVRPVWTYVLLPGAIFIAAILISGAYVYVNYGAKSQSTDGPYTVDDIKKWAGTIKGMDKKAFATCLDSGKYTDYVMKDQKSGETLGMVGQNAGTPAFFIDGNLLLGAQPISEFQTAIDKTLTPQEQKKANLIVLTEQDHILGDANAPHTIIEYSDFQCPFCRRFFDETYSQLKKDYIDTGKARLVYRHFPLTQLHPVAVKSAEATECANEQGKFWQMHDAIFTLQVK